ncbi:MAG: metal ABC transporter permease, partial [Deltaproteobacteria bacterium]|nr:metal ABC transporter permease [Deltaproteobacteria bacterium]
LTEKEIQHSLVEVSRNRTTLVIAHRLSTIIDADEILVLKDGEIVEQGNHNDLVEQDGEYASIWMRQREAREYQSRLLDIEKSCWIEPVEV